MRTFIISSLILLLSITNLTAQEKSNISIEQDYIVLTRKIPQLKPILITAKELRDEAPQTFGEYEVVICGKTVKDLEDHTKIQPFLDQAKQLGVEIFACGFSLEKFKVNQNKLPKDLQVVKNGILYNFKKQKEGYLSIEL